MSDPLGYPYGGTDFPNSMYCNRCNRVDCDCWKIAAKELSEVLLKIGKHQKGK